MITPEVGKYYQDDNCILRVDEIGSFGETIGIMVDFNKNFSTVLIECNTSFDYMFSDEWETKEITKETFDKKLKEAQDFTNKLFNNLID